MYAIYILVAILLIYFFSKETEKLYIITFVKIPQVSDTYKIDKNIIRWTSEGITNGNKIISNVPSDPDFSLFISELKPSSSRPSEIISASGTPDQLKQIQLKFNKCLKRTFLEVNARDKYYDNDRRVKMTDNNFGYKYDCALTNNAIDNCLILFKNKVLYLELSDLKPVSTVRFVKIFNPSKIFRLRLPNVIDYDLGKVNLISKTGFKRPLCKDNSGFFQCMKFDYPNKCEIIDINNNKIVLYNIEPNYLYYYG